MLQAAYMEETGAEHARWRAVEARDRSARGFVYGVVTTGVYCLAGCPSPAPRRENVAFFDDVADARAAGFRACRRCLPDTDGVPPWFEDAARALTAGDSSVAGVADGLGISRATLHRVFVQTLAVSPAEFRRAAADRRFREALADADSVLDACFAAGIGAASTAYARSGSLGASPAGLRRGGAGLELDWTTGRCSLGALVAASTDTGLCLLEFLDEGADADADAEAAVRSRFPQATLRRADAGEDARLAQAIAAVDRPEAARHLPLDVRGTAFQQRVWSALRTLPRGSRASYGALAEQIGRPGAARAVARAVASNPVAVIVPCHRIVGADGTLTGYRWGLERKRVLLDREAEGTKGEEGP